MKKLVLIIAMLPAILSQISAQELKLEKIKYGDMNQWVTREIKESGIIGGDTKTLYEIAPNMKYDGARAYSNMGGSPWATSNVYAKVAGIVKTSNAVWREPRDSSGNYCAKMGTVLEHVKALGIINMDVLVSGSIFLGEVFEPISSTKSPYSKMEMGIPYTKRPDYLVYDYKVYVPSGERIYSSGFGSKKTLPGQDYAEVYVLLQKRWEDADGNLHALRVGTGRERFGTTTKDWNNGHKLPIHYGDITKESFYKPYMGLIPADRAYYARNSKGKMVPVIEEGWANANETPTHVQVMASSGCGVAYEGTVGMNLWVDNLAFGFK